VVAQALAFKRRERGKNAAVGNATFSRTTVLDAAQLRRKPLQVGDFSFDLLQVIFRDAINA
jgi:hypothetical protein